MAFNIKINACIEGKDTIPLGEYSNCSSIVLKKIDILNEESLTNGALVNNLYKIQYTVTSESGVSGDPGYIRKIYTNTDDSSIYFLTKIYAYDSSENVVIGSVKNLIDVINNNESGAEIIYYQNIELKCIYEKKIPVCVATNNKYYGDPWILYGDENSKTIKVKEISINDTCEKFWICENKTSWEAVDFDYWNIKIHQVVFKSGNICEDNIHTSQTINKGDSKLLNLATVTFNLDVNNSDMNLYLVRNENVLSLNNLKKLDIYSTFNTCIETIDNTLEELQDGDSTIESIGYYLELTACYSPNNVWITVRKRNGEPQYLKKYLFGSDISEEYINAPKRGGYVFDGFYINPNTEIDGNSDEVPEDNETLGSNYIRVTDGTGKFIQTATNFLDEYHYINPVNYKYVIANYEKAKTKVKLDWQINGKGYTKNGEVFSDDKLDKNRIIEFNDAVSKHKIKNIPTDLKVKQNGVDVKLTFMGFYTIRDGWGDKVIKADGNFKTDLLSWTSGGRWRSNRFSTSDDEITLYAYWTSGSYIELDRVGGTGGSGSFPVKYKENMYNRVLTKPIRYVDSSDPTSDELNFKGYWVDDYKTRVTWNGGGFIINKKKKDGTKLTNTLNQWLLQKPITLYAYWYSDKYTVYANSNIDACTAQVNNRNKVIKRTDEKVTLTASYDKLRFNFNGWYVNNSRFSTNQTVERTILTSDVNSAENRIDYNANFENRKYTIYYKDPDNYQYGKLTFYYDLYLQNLYIPQKAGYKFVGWFSDKALTNQVTYINEGNGGNGEGTNGADVAKTNLTSNGTVQEITLYAKWEKIIIEGRYILKPGKGAWKTDVNLPQIDTTIVYGNKMPSINEDLIPVREGYSFIGFYDKDNYKVIDKECTDWIKNTFYVDGDGNSIMTDTYVFTAKFSKDVVIDPGEFDRFTKSLNCNITTHSNVDFKNSIENKIATIDWINTAIGIPEINYYDDLIKNFYNSDIVETYNSSKGLADKYFFNDFDFDNNKLLKQSDIIEFFDNSATELKNDFYLKEIKYDVSNDKTIMSINFIERTRPLYSSEYSGSKDTIIYFTINDDKSVVYKMCIDEIKTSTRFEINLKYFDIEFPHLTDYINKITIEHISCFAIENSDNTRTYYKPYLVFNKFTDLDLTIEKNTILDNVEIKEYDSDTLETPSLPGVDVV